MAITIQNLTYYIGERRLLEIPNLIIPNNSKIGIVGKNGCGKTTLLKLISGELEPDEGSIDYQGEIAMIDQFIVTGSSKSGGEQTKEKIRKSIHQGTRLILADEPTNHLDSRGREYLMKELSRFEGTVLMVSHDRDFLNQMCEEIIEISDGKVSHYQGDYDQYLEQKEIEEKEQLRKYDAYVKEKERLGTSINELHKKSAGIKKAPKRMGNSEARLHTRGKGTIAKGVISRQAQRIETRLEKLEKVEKPWQKKELIIPFSEGQKVHKTNVIEADNLELSVDERILLKNSSFKIKTGIRTALVGANGVGKTTLLKAILNKKKPITVSQKAKFAYFSQSFNQLDETKSILDNVQQTSIHDPQVARDLLAHLLFRGHEVNKRVEVLSGGERTKVAIAKLILGDSNVLILDEPTNHLDIESLEVLEESLKAYQGTIIFVSHDPFFIKNVGEEILELKNHGVINLTQGVAVKKRDSKKEDKMVLEMRKTKILSDLSYPIDENQKQSLEIELSEITKKLRDF